MKTQKPPGAYIASWRLLFNLNYKKDNYWDIK